MEGGSRSVTAARGGRGSKSPPSHRPPMDGPRRTGAVRWGPASDRRSAWGAGCLHGTADHDRDVRVAGSGRTPDRAGRIAVRAEFYRADAPDQIVGQARWRSSGVEFLTEDAPVRAALQRIFRPTAVVVDDPSLRPFGTSGPIVLQPGGLRWFHEAALARAPAEAVVARLVPERGASVGYDPAGLYRPLNEQWERREGT